MKIFFTMIFLILLGGNALAANWEYKIKEYNRNIEYKKEIEGDLNKEGLSGWEVVAVTNEPRMGAGFQGYITVYFKRQLTDKAVKG